MQVRHLAWFLTGRVAEKRFGPPARLHILHGLFAGFCSNLWLAYNA